ncbi:FMN-dependent NADH-azoreductase [Salinisphaera orenii]|uniref:FMN dependent NADH:quinone oxidoreductase n=1 Tax=Salinisphaera orenii YIM 95161 TaxID=1051139 RepID=A0A423PFQ2_9GAMM|nr:NAD(P)H-dependent oxidoreductase [Salinisphaera halophila]ROO24418.1 NAD(P)H dehydrogenase (quinone) [Salinisphaera halophila YIM 95161]
MSHILHMDASARPGLAGTDHHGSHSRYLSHQFVSRWQSRRPEDAVVYRDLGQCPPSFINHDWVASAFTPDERREPWMRDALAESDELVDELIAADIVVIGTPLYNFGMPAPLKTWVDQVVRIGRTVDIDETNPSETYIAKLADRERHVVVLAARGGMNMATGEEMAHMNHLESLLASAFVFIGITRMHTVATEGQEAGGEVLAKSIADATRKVERLVDELQVAANATPRNALPARAGTLDTA